MDTDARRVAVVVVHGVADPLPGASARAVADLLIQQPGSEWRQGEEIGLTMPVASLPLAASAGGGQTPRLDERSQGFRDRLEAPDNQRTGRGDASFAFQEGILEGYRASPRRTYRTPRITVESSNGDALPIDVIEFHWGDLSRVGQGPVRFFGDLYQLLLHLPSLGRHAVDAEAVCSGSGQWRRFAQRQAWLIRILTLGIVLLNLAMVPPATAIASSAVPGTWRMGVLLLVGALGGGAVVSLLGLRRGWGRGVLEALLGTSGGALTAWAMERGLGADNALAAIAWAAAALLAFHAARLYETLRPGAALGTLLGLAVTALGAGGMLLAGAERGDAVLISVQVLTVVFAALRLLWLALFVLATAQMISAWWLPPLEPDTPRSLWTARFSLGLATWAFLVVTLALWALAGRMAAPLLPTTCVDPWDLGVSIGGRTLSPLPALLTAPDQSLRDFVKEAVTAGGGFTFTGALIVLLLFLAALVLGLAPSVRDEVRPPPAAAEPDPPDFATQHARTTAGLELTFWSADALSIGLALAVVSTVLVSVLGWASGKETLQWSAGGLLLSLFIGRGWLGKARVPLDVVLDVDNYMRHRPRGDAPRVRMFERLHAILGHLGPGRDAGAPYQAVILVAHSQGSVIVADYLRLAKRKGWLAPGQPELHLMTMGCPLKQLYGRSFPALYDWVGSIATSLSDFGLSSWSNLYRAGDYIGRELDLGSGKGSARDIEVGLGAHTHYWDETAPVVGRELTVLVRRVCAGRRGPAHDASRANGI